ncbi:MAG: 2-C-methyl-D-erythritol 2,4-cyclodiphosphate synthase [Deltaproteobacteria bacterium]|nr:2-C-methyl-D-erythritol 2,4-cyclodiphosphate synthase [Deltaproteobacteria bacterium]
MRIGIGYDVHRLVKGRKLVLGGETIPFDNKGLLGHSDADALIHAICDGLLGASGLGDIGQHFPDSNPELKDISSIKLLSRTCEMIRDKGFSIINIDSTVFAEKPKLTPYKESMLSNIAETAGVEPEQVNIKATTTEGLGYIGTGEGIGAMCVVLLENNNKQDK